MIADYGFQRLVLLNSAGYQRAELPLDDSVSLIAPNNTGKTSLINALQFLLIIDTRRMDFGAHDLAITRRFYFPDHSAYILLEVLLPQSGTVVFGCVGKGVSHDYEYFAYRGELKVEDYRTADDTLVTQPQLINHLATRGRVAYRFDAASFARLVYGGDLTRRADIPDFTIFKLENSHDAKVFQEVLTRTLRLDKLDSRKVKEYLQKIFRRDLSEASIDFKQEWERAFHDVNAERMQYTAAVRLQPLLEKLESQHQQRLVVRGQLVDWRQRVNTGLENWHAHCQAEQARLATEHVELERRQSEFFDHLRQQEAARLQAQQQSAQLQHDNTEHARLENRFTLVTSRDTLAAAAADMRAQLEDITLLLRQTEGRPLHVIEAELQRERRQLAQVAAELAAGDANLYRRLEAQLPPAALDRANRVLSPAAMALPADTVAVDPASLRAALGGTPAQPVQIAGLTLPVQTLPPQYTARSAEELRELQADARRSINSLQQQLAATRSRAASMARKQHLQSELSKCEQGLADYDRLLELRAHAAERATALSALAAQLQEMQARQAHSHEEEQQLRRALTTNERASGKLADDDHIIAALRNQRLDHDTAFTALPDLPQQAWLGETDWPLETLATRLRQYQELCRTLLHLNGELRVGLMEVHAGGLTKYQFAGAEDDELGHLFAFLHQLDKEREALERKARSAVVNVTVSLRLLRNGLDELQVRLRGFNRLISRQQLSDLAVFKIEAVEETRLVEAIDLLISTAAQVEDGESFNLFNQKSVLDDAQLDRARQCLVDEGNARHGLRIGDLFRLVFVVGKEGRPPEQFEDIDSAASNGTVLMAKLITGLAMLHQMQDKRSHFRAVCYLDEALALDSRNQKNLITTAAEFGYALIFASPAPLTSVRYCVPILHADGMNHISRASWQTLEPLDETPTGPTAEPRADPQKPQS